MKTIDNIHYMTIPPLRRASLEARDDLNKRLMDSLYQQRCDDDLPESIQIARVNGKLMRGEISQAESYRKIYTIRAKFEGDSEGIGEIR